MNIYYVGNHNQRNSNDDEGAIAYCLRMQGHSVYVHPERKATGNVLLTVPHSLPQPEVVLYHKWADYKAIRALEAAGVKTACWYFDRVAEPATDLSAAARCSARVEHLVKAEECGSTVFCTDGDWVAARNSPKVRVLWQGADPRLSSPLPIGPGKLPERVLFLGNGKWSAGRTDFVQWLYAESPMPVEQVSAGLHGKALADRLRSGADLVVAPDSPGSDRYWSNRLYLVLGFCGWLLHPAWAGLDAEYPPDALFRYTDREHLLTLLHTFQTDPSALAPHRVRRNGYEVTQARHMYSHRTRELMAVLTGAAQ